MTVPGSSLVVAQPSDSDAVVDLLVEAFFDDPLWRAILVDPGTRPQLLRMLWKVFSDNAISYSTLFLNRDRTAAAVWFAPGGVEMTDAENDRVEAELKEVLGVGAQHVIDALAAFDEAHPHHEPHYLLSLLGTAVEHRGHGYGLALLADTLQIVDAADSAAYLEASNPVNVGLYERYGFERFGEFTIPDGPTVTTMWRPRWSAG